MTSEYKYRYKIGDKDKKLIPLLLSQGKGIRYVCDKYGLSKRFISNKYYLLLRAKGCNLGAKRVPYYDNENSYGKNTHHYTMDELSLDEKKILDEL